MVHAYTAPEHWKQADTLMESQLAARWQSRIRTMAERLETQARRLLQLEAALAHFAERYYTTLEAAVLQLAALDGTHGALADFALAEEQCGSSQRRVDEVKARYRSLARVLHTDHASSAEYLQRLHNAYHGGDLAALLGMEAELFLTQLVTRNIRATMELETALYDVSRAADTYAEGYRARLHSPLYELMLRDQAAAQEGWDYTAALLHKLQEAIAAKEVPVEA